MTDVPRTADQLMGDITQIKRNYQLTFDLQQPANVFVLEDLATFCRAAESTAVPGDRDKTMLLEGRREVWLRLQTLLNLSPDQIFALWARDVRSVVKRIDGEIR